MSDEERRREEWAKVRDLLAAAMMMANAWDAMGCPQDATRKRVQDALEQFGK